MAVNIAPFIKVPDNIGFTPTRQNERNFRNYLVPIGVALVMLIFFARLFQLTIVKGSYYRHIAEDNRIREVAIEGQRGTILDRKGLIIAESIGQDIELTASESPAEGIEQTAAEATEQSTKQETNTNTVTYTRQYNNNFALAHILGYRQIASQEHLDGDACQEPLIRNDKIGVKGVEKVYECHVRPIKGKRLVEVDSAGKEIRVISQVEPKAGKPLKLSIDSFLQQKTYDIIENNDITTSVEVDLTDHNIAVVALEPQTGEILTLLSYPSFDPQRFEDQPDTTIEYFEDKREPLFNRGLLGTYPPGSVFKTVLAVGALEEGKISETDTITDKGFIEAGPIKFHNWLYTKYGRTDGEVDLRKGIQRSNDIYFYRLGEQLGPEGIKKWANIFGYGKTTGSPFSEADGTIPSDFWKRETVGEKWYLGDTYNLSIGQGYVLTTPLQVTRAMAVFANGGRLCTPTPLRLDAEENGELVENGADCVDVEMSDETLTAVREGMKLACESGGTGWPFFDFRVAGYDNGPEEDRDRLLVGCKTGTAESHKPDAGPHAWFTVFAPYDDPKIVLTVMVEEGGEGSNVAAPIAKRVLEEYFGRRE